MIELVAITDDPTPPPGPLRAVRSGGLSMVWTAAPEAAEPTADELWRRGELLEQLLADRDVLPVRYGTVLPDEDAAARVLDERHDELAAGLDRIRGAVELALRVRPADDEAHRQLAVAPSSGREYLGAKTGGVRAATAVHQSLTAVAREGVVQPGGDLLRAAYLVDRGEVDAFVVLVRRLQTQRPDLALVCTGPWPPFSFTGGGMDR